MPTASAHSPSLEYKLDTECVGVNTTAMFPEFPTGTGVIGRSKNTAAGGTVSATATGASSGSGSSSFGAGRVSRGWNW